MLSWQDFLRSVSNPEAPWLTVEHHVGPEAVTAAYAKVLAGKGDPRSGHMLSLANLEA